MLNTSRAFFQKRSALVSGDLVVKAIINTELAKNIYKVKMKKYREKFLNYDNKYPQVYMTIWVNFEEDPRIHIKGIKCLYEISLILKNNYKLFNLATYYNIVSQMVYHTQFDFSTIVIYG